MEILLDTSFLIAYHNKRDDHHERAREIDIENAGINDYVYTEILNILHSRQSHRKASEYGKFLRKSLEISRVSKPVFEKAVENFEAEKISFTDAAITATAQKLDIKKVASFDQDFDNFKDFTRVY